MENQIEDDYNILSGDDIQTDVDHETSEVALSVIWQANRLGAAYYEFDTDHLYLMPDYSDTAPTFTMLKLLLKQLQAHYIITSCKTDKNVVEILNNACRGIIHGTSVQSPDASSVVHNVHLLPHANFVYESCRYHLQNLNIPGMPPNMSDTERRIYFSSLIDFGSPCMVKAAGGLLKFVQKKSLTDSLSVSAISTFTMEDVVNMDEYTYRSLQIFQSERHPSVYKNTSGIKEGLSLFGICNKCKSSIGKKELRRWFLHPTNNISVIKERHAAINFFTQSKNVEVLNSLQNSLKSVQYLPKIFVRMQAAQASMNDWKTLYKTAYNCMIIGEICRSHAASLDIFSEIAAKFSSDIFRVANLMDKVIDFEEYARQNHFAVKPGVDSEIDKMKQLYNGLPDFMTQIAQQEIVELPPGIERCSIIYLPQLGYLLTFPMTEEMKQTKDYSLPNLRFMFVLTDTVYYKSARTKKLDSLLGDTLCDIYDKETKIMHKLQNIILKLKDDFFTAIDLLAKLDCLIAMAVVAKEFNWIQPEMVESGPFEVKNSRHPLQELCVSSFVPNDIYSGGSLSKIKVLTGPNSSGKSTYLKQVALIAFMAHIGCFVPAQEAKIPLLSSIHSCVETVESVSISLSSFLISLNQLSICLNYSSKSTLVVIDEFGKYTEGVSGLALVVSALRFWLQQGIASPHVFLATHYLSVSNYIFDSPYISFQTIDVMMNDDGLVIFHQLVDGIASLSYAADTALKAGLPDNLIERGLQVTKSIQQNQPIPLTDDNFLSEKLNKYSSMYCAFVDLDVDSDESVQHFMKFVRERAGV